MKLRDLNINITDSSGNLRDIDEIIAQLQDLFLNFDTHSMNDGVLYLQGQKDAIGDMLEYLKRVSGGDKYSGEIHTLPGTIEGWVLDEQSFN